MDYIDIWYDKWHHNAHSHYTLYIHIISSFLILKGKKTTPQRPQWCTEASFSSTIPGQHVSWNTEATCLKWGTQKDVHFLIHSAMGGMCLPLDLVLHSWTVIYYTQISWSIYIYHAAKTLKSGVFVVMCFQPVCYGLSSIWLQASVFFAANLSTMYL